MSGLAFITFLLRSDSNALDQLFSYAGYGIAFLAFVAAYLGIFDTTSSRRTRPDPDPETVYAIVQEMRNFLAHPRPNNAPPVQINVDEDLKNQLLAKLEAQNQAALSKFIESEVFKKAAASDIKANQSRELAKSMDEDIDHYQDDMASWRKNANVNLIIGLSCAVAGIAVMWQTLITIDAIAGDWRANLYHFLARFGLVLIVESVAFFFLKLYREDRAMIRYFRNEITNLESKATALNAALNFGTPADLSKVLQSLTSTERNFLVKKGDRVMSDINYENSEILIEKIFNRPDVIERLAKAVGKAS